MMARDKAVVEGLEYLGAETQPVWLEDLCGHLRRTGYRTERGGSIVKQADFVCSWLAGRRHEIRMGFRVVRVEPDYYRLERLLDDDNDSRL